MRTLTRLAGACLVLAASFSAYAVISDRGHQPFHIGLRDLRFFDLRVYRGAATRVIDSHGLYRHPIIGRLGFTYPPAAALVLAPLALVPLAADEITVTALNVVALVWMLYSTLRFARVDRRRGALAAGAVLIAAAALWTEPVTVTLGYGQIDLLIVALIMFDFSRPEGARGKGLAIGIAAGLKLTPLMFIIYLALSGRRREAVTATGAFAATILISFLAAGRAAARYWGGLVLDSSRVGGAGDPGNQSLRGALSRLTDTPHPGVGTELIIVLIALGGLSLAVAAMRRGQPTLGFGLCAITTLLASPVSWTHHWTLAIPAIVLLAIAAYRERSAVLAMSTLLATTVMFAYLPERFMGRRHFLITGARSLPADSYVLLGLLVLTAAAAYQFRLSSLPARSSLGRLAPQ